MKELWYGRYLPPEIAVLLISVIGILIMLQQKKLAISLFLLALGTMVTPMFIESAKPMAIEFLQAFKMLLLSLPIYKAILVVFVTLYLLSKPFRHCYL